jgi:hypothetical protein
MSVDSRILILSPRISYAKNICSEYNEKLEEEKQFICYKDIKDKRQLNFKKKIVISMEGLHYLESFTPDLLIIDECNANLVAHISKTNGKWLDSNLYHFQRMLTYSKNVIVADAFLGSKVCNFFTDLQISLYVYKYHRKLDKKNAIMINGTDKSVKKEINKQFNGNDRDIAKCKIDKSVNNIIRLLEEGKKVYAYFSTKKLLDYLELQVGKKYKCLFYSGTSQNSIPDSLNDEWSKYDLIATTCTITIGINHNLKNVFNTKIIDFNSSSHNNISDAIQSHYRVRYITDDDIYIKVDENHISTNFPINMKHLEENLKHKVDWYAKNGKCFESVEPYINNLIKHNYIENQLSQVAPKKMMIKYLEDCNYNIMEDVETDIIDVKEEIIDIEEENFNLLKEFMRNEPTQSRMIELEKAKLTRKLTQNELDQMNKFWFINMYTGGTSKGFREANLPTIAVAYRLWMAKFNGNKSLRAMRLEKQLLNGEITIDDLISKRWNHTQYSELQNQDIMKIQRILEVCKRLGLKHSNDCDTIITQESIDNFYKEAKSEYQNIRKDMGIRDRRKNKDDDITHKQFTGLIKNCFTESEQSLCNLTVHKSGKKVIEGKRVNTHTYKLCPRKNITVKGLLVNDIIDEQMENNENNDYTKIDTQKLPQLLYENLQLTDTSVEKPMKRLLTST